ncbi:MAG: hypothetical protein GY701_02160 [Sulfitobacter sp.]|nr:hypothetical protein [Sulfitobacter sp.]
MRNYILSLLLTLSVLPAWAATVDVTLDPQTAGPFALGETFTLDIVAGFFAPDHPDGTANVLVGGSVSVDWDPAVLRLDAVEVNPEIRDFDFSNGTIDQVNGFVDNIGFGTFGNKANNMFTVATLSFEAAGAGVSALLLTDPDTTQFRWASTVDFGNVTPIHTNGSVTVVPIPAAGYLMFSALLLLARRRSLI